MSRRKKYKIKIMNRLMKRHKLINIQKCEDENVLCLYYIGETRNKKFSAFNAQGQSLFFGYPLYDSYDEALKDCQTYDRMVYDDWLTRPE